PFATTMARAASYVFVVRLAALELQKNLYPACEMNTRLFQSSKSEFVNSRGQSTTCVCDNKNFKSIFQSGEHRKGDASLAEESSHDQSFSIGGKNRVSGCIVLPHVHIFSFDGLDGRERLLQGRKQGTTVDTRNRC